MDIGRKKLLGAPLGGWTMQPLTIRTPDVLATADTVIAWTEFAGIMIDEIVLHSTSTPDVLEGISCEE